MDKKIRVAVLTGGHPYDVPAFNACLRAMPGLDCHIQSIEEFCTDFGKYTDRYDVVVFFNMTRPTPQEEPAWDTVDKVSLANIAERGQGMVVLHHAVMAFEDWDEWSVVTGMPDRKEYEYHFDQEVPLHIADSEHPITKGLSDWQLIDETYLAKPTDADSHILVTTTCKTSMDTIAWTRMYRGTRVFCLQSGHDRKVYGDESFRRILEQGIQWACGKI